MLEIIVINKNYFVVYSTINFQIIGLSGHNFTI